jgi:hypothetical protein
MWFLTRSEQRRVPYSKHVFDEAIEEILRALRPASVLDVGAGAGKYAAIVRRACPGARIVAVERDETYIPRFGLAEKYDEVLTVDAMSLMADVDRDYDVVILGDVIEHLRKSDGIDLLNFLVYRARKIIVVFPLRNRQGAVDGHVHEAHISVWGPNDFLWCDSTYVVERKIALVQIEGFLE